MLKANSCRGEDEIQQGQDTRSFHQVTQSDLMSALSYAPKYSQFIIGRDERRGRCLRRAQIPRDSKTNEEAWQHYDDTSFVAKHTRTFLHASAIE